MTTTDAPFGVSADAHAEWPWKFAVRLVETGETYLCGANQTLLQGLASIGRRGIPAGCLNGGCGVCKVVVRSGKVRRTGPMSRAHVSADEEENGVLLACRAAPLGAVELEVVGRMQKSVCRTSVK